MTETRTWVLKKRPTVDIEADTLQLTEYTLPALKDGEFLLRNILLSLDATNRIWMSDWDSYLPPVDLGAGMRGIVVGEVMESRHKDFPKGGLATGVSTWSEYVVSNGAGLQPLAAMPGLKTEDAFGVMAIAGPTAMIGLHDIGRIKKGDTVVVTAAAGAVGMLTGQIARLHGCRTIGIAGGAEKCKWLTEEFGYDHAIDYKKENVEARLKALAPDGVDVHFENVGGAMLDAGLHAMKLGGTVVICGLIASYNSTEPVPGPYNFREVIFKRLRIEGFVCLDYMAKYPEYQQQLGKWILEGKLKYRLHVVDGIEHAVDTLKLLYSGGNHGKLMVRLGADPK